MQFEIIFLSTPLRKIVEIKLKLQKISYQLFQIFLLCLEDEVKMRDQLSLQQ